MKFSYLAMGLALFGSSVNGQVPDELPIAFGSDRTGEFEIYFTHPNGMQTTQLTSPPNSGGGYLAWSPNGKQVAFYKKYDDRKTWSIHTVNVDGTGWQRLTHKKHTWDSSPAYSPDGQKIVFARTYRDEDSVIHNELWLMNHDGTEQVKIPNANGGGPYFVSNNTIVYHAQFIDKQSEIAIINTDGSRASLLTNNDADEWHPELSPDGQEIVFTSNRDGNFEIYVMNINGSNPRRLTQNSVRDSMPSWSPDGSQIIYTSRRDDVVGVYLMNRDGSGEKRIVEQGGQPAWYKPR